ncbi:Protein of unknown function [Propionibacterium freudenreichii]|nr:Protein of unknown function [Propionibacterium freudenreichii]
MMKAVASVRVANASMKGPSRRRGNSTLAGYDSKLERPQ